MTEIVVTAPARLHFGMLDPAGIGASSFGGCGVAVESPRVVVAVGSASDQEVTARGPQADRATAFARRARDAFGHRGGVEIEVREAIPPHAGLGAQALVLRLVSEDERRVRRGLEFAHQGSRRLMGRGA